MRDVLQSLREAHVQSEKFYAKQLNPGEMVKPVDLFDMALAFETEEKIIIDLELVRSEEFPNWYTPQRIEKLNTERVRLVKRIEAWKNRQFPHQPKIN